MNENTNEQEQTTMNENTNEQEQTMNSRDDMIETIANIIKNGYAISTQNDAYQAILAKIAGLKTAIANAADDYIKQPLQNALDRLEIEKNTYEQSELLKYINGIFIRVANYMTGYTPKTAKKSSISNGKKSSEYTYTMAIMDNIDAENWITAKTLCERIETAKKLDSVASNPTGWKRAVSTALINLMSKHIIERNEKHEYRKIA